MIFGRQVAVSGREEYWRFMSIKGIGKRTGDLAYRFATSGCGCDGSCQGCQGYCIEEPASTKGRQVGKSCAVENSESTTYKL